MFTRIVKMEFKEETITAFLKHFETIKTQIRNFEGCHFLELYRDKRAPHIFFTYSKWESTQALDNYRNSNLFNEVWAQTKPKFSQKAQAWSVDTLHHLP